MPKSGSKVFLASLIGVAIGVGIGLLYAPAKGSKTRKRLKKKIMNAADIMQDDISDKISALQSAFSEEEEEETSGENTMAKEGGK
jgi:gas vesicle protein